MKVIFLDRDGIINVERGDYTWRKEDFVFTDGLFDALKEFRSMGYELIIITNQGGIDKGRYTHQDVRKLHEWMKEKLEQEGITLRDVYYCPHHTDVQPCICRKPESLLFEKAGKVHGVDTKSSIMIGDKQRDLDAAAGAGIRGYLLEANSDWANLDLKALLSHV